VVAVSFTVDNYDGGCQATRHLLDQGFQKIAHISGPLTFWDARARKSGWRDTLNQNGMSVSDDHCAEGDWSAASGSDAVLKLLSSYPDMDAIFVANDQMAIGAIQRLQERGLHVPNDLAIIGYDNIPESAYNSPSLSTISQDFHMMGKKSVDLLVEAIDAQRTGKNMLSVKPVKLVSELIVRTSSLRNVSA
jgi:LacI family transcriptional regulator